MKILMDIRDDINKIRLGLVETNPDNPHFKSGDKMIVSEGDGWSNINDGDFILINIEGEEIPHDRVVVRVNFLKNGISLSPLSSFSIFKFKEVMFNDLSSIKIYGKLLGIARSYDERFDLKEMHAIDLGE